MRSKNLVFAGCSNPMAFSCLALLTVFAALSLPGRVSTAAESLMEKTEDYTDLWKRGDYKGALKALDVLLVEHASPGPMKWMFDRAELRYEIGRIDEAIDDLETLQDRYPSPTDTLRLGGVFVVLVHED